MDDARSPRSMSPDQCVQVTNDTGWQCLKSIDQCSLSLDHAFSPRIMLAECYVSGKGNGGGQRLMSPNRCLKAKGDVDDPCTTIIERFSQAIVFIRCSKVTPIEKCAGYK